MGTKNYSILRYARPLQEAKCILLRLFLQEFWIRGQNKKRTAESLTTTLLPSKRFILVWWLFLPHWKVKRVMRQSRRVQRIQHHEFVYYWMLFLWKVVEGRQNYALYDLRYGTSRLNTNKSPGKLFTSWIVETANNIIKDPGHFLWGIY